MLITIFSSTNLQYFPWALLFKSLRAVILALRKSLKHICHIGSYRGVIPWSTKRKHECSHTGGVIKWSTEEKHRFSHTWDDGMVYREKTDMLGWVWVGQYNIVYSIVAYNPCMSVAGAYNYLIQEYLHIFTFRRSAIQT